MTKHLATAMIALLCLAFAASAASKTSVADWSEERGPATAARLIASCVKTGPGVADSNIACLGVAFDACTRDNGGHTTQYDLNVCRKYSYQAWRARYERTLAGFDKLFQAWTRPGAEKWRRAMAARFRTQEKAWRRWTAADCEMWELGSVGGSIHSYAVTTCEERHIALRTLRLAPLLEWNETH